MEGGWKERLGHRSNAGMFNPLFLRSKVYIAEDSWEHPAFINPSPRVIHDRWSTTTNQEKDRRAAARPGEFRAQGRGTVDMGTAEKADTQAEREVTRNRQANIRRSCEQELATRKCLAASTQGECPRCRRTEMQKLGTPFALWLRFCRQTERGSISPRCGPLLRQE